MRGLVTDGKPERPNIGKSRGVLAASTILTVNVASPCRIIRWPSNAPPPEVSPGTRPGFQIFVVRLELHDDFRQRAKTSNHLTQDMGAWPAHVGRRPKVGFVSRPKSYPLWDGAALAHGPSVISIRMRA